MKGTPAKELRAKSQEDLLTELNNYRDELQKIRFTKSAGTAVAKLSKIRTLRKNIAKVLTILSQQRKQAVLSTLLTRTKTVVDESGEKKEETHTIKNIKLKHVPRDLRPKLTRAKRRALTKSQATRLPVKLLKRKLNYPKRSFAVPL